MKFHPYTEIFPLMTGEEYDGLKDDIRRHGLRQPIIVHAGQIVDGRNRWRACHELKIEPTFENWRENGSLAAFIWSENFHRRHLSAGAKAVAAIEIEKCYATEAKERQRKHGDTAPGRKSLPVRIPEVSKDHNGESREQAAAVVGVSASYIQQAKLVAATDPELVTQVRDGTLTLPQAVRRVQRDKKRRELSQRANKISSSKETELASIIVGDCIEVMGGMKAGTFRLIFADPPYNIGVDYGEGTRADKLPKEDFAVWCRQWLAECKRLLTPDGSLWVLINDENAAHVFTSIENLGLHFRNWIKWYETFGVNCQTKFNRCSRHLLYFVADPKRHVFNTDAVSRPSDRQTKYQDKRADPGGKILDDVWQMPRLVDNAQERIPDFPTQLPVALLERIVLCASDAGDVVLDPFSGSGTTGVASVRHGRIHVGIEKFATFAKLAKKRLLAETPS